MTLLAHASKFSISNLLTVATLLNPAAATAAAAVAHAPGFARDDAGLPRRGSRIFSKSGLSLDALTYLLTPPVIRSRNRHDHARSSHHGNSQTTITVAERCGFPNA